MIRTLLDQIRNFYQRQAPVACSADFLISPPSEAEISQFETDLQEPLPSDYREFLLYNDLRHNFNANFECLDFHAVVDRWQMMKGLLEQGSFDDGRVAYHREHEFGNWDGAYLQEVWWHPQWVPFAADSCGNMMCIDCAPGKNGVKYQLLDMEVMDGQGPFVSDYASFTDYLQSHLAYLQNGQYEVFEWGIEVDRWRPVRKSG